MSRYEERVACIARADTNLVTLLQPSSEADVGMAQLAILLG